MILGQSAATGAVLAMQGKKSVQEVQYEALKEKLLGDKQVLEWKTKPGQGAIDANSLKGIVVDDDDAVKTGFASHSSASKPHVGSGYSHDGNMDKGKIHCSLYPMILRIHLANPLELNDGLQDMIS